MQRGNYTYIYAFLIFVTLSFVNDASADENREYQLKAAYLLNFARFVYWPEVSESNDTNEFSICVYGSNPFSDSLDLLANKKIQKKSIQLIYTQELSDKKTCDIVFVSRSEVATYQSVISELPKGTLTVSDIKDFIESGGMIGFVTVNNKIKFEINVKNSMDAGIKYRSQLLEVAEQLK